MNNTVVLLFVAVVNYQVLTSKEEEAPVSRTEQAKRLLAQYGSAYLITSISFAIVSFACCYAAVSAGACHSAQTGCVCVGRPCVCWWGVCVCVSGV
jgi:hypothetical protein